MRRPRSVRLPVLVLAFAGLASCGGDGTEPNLDNDASRVASVQFAADTVLMELGTQLVIRPDMFDANGVPLPGVPAAFSVTGAAIIEVDNLGVVTSLAIGHSRLTVTVNGIQGSVVVRVITPIASMRITPAEATITLGNSVQLELELLDENQEVIPIAVPATWQVVNPAIATVNSTGTVAGLSVGTTTVSAQFRSRTATALIIVGQ